MNDDASPHRFSERLPFMPRLESEFTIEWGRGLIVDHRGARHADDGSPCAGPKCPDHKHLKWIKPRKRRKEKPRGRR